MKQIILISRIHPYEGQEEFSKYSDGDKPILKEAEGLGLLIIKGSAFYGLPKNSLLAASVLDTACKYKLDVDVETVIAYHFSNNIDKALLTKFQSVGWNRINIKQYGTGGSEQTEPLYGILNPLGVAIKSDPGSNQADQVTAQLIEKLWRFFSRDPVLEAKHKLLQMIVRGEIPNSVGEEIKDFQGAVDIFRAATKGKSIFSDEYKEAYTSLLDALGFE
jgi:hypothetical protein